MCQSCGSRMMLQNEYLPGKIGIDAPRTGFRKIHTPPHQKSPGIRKSEAIFEIKNSSRSRVANDFFRMS